MTGGPSDGDGDGSGGACQLVGKKTVTKEEVISKLKDDGDFDNLRLKIIRKLKDNEEFRQSVICIIRQSAAINRSGAESMRPRQLSDAIYDEVGDKVTSLVSDGLWEIIRSSNGGMRDEISKTVQSVYNKLVEPEVKWEDRSSDHGIDANAATNHAEDQGTAGALAGARDDGSTDREPNEPPGFSVSINCDSERSANKVEMKMPSHFEGQLGHAEEANEQPKDGDVVEMNDVDLGVPPGFAADDEHKLPWDGSDEDPEVPPGFG